VRAKTQTSVLEIRFYPRPSISGKMRSRDRYAQKQFSARVKLVCKVSRVPDCIYTDNKLQTPGVGWGTTARRVDWRAKRNPAGKRARVRRPGASAHNQGLSVQAPPHALLACRMFMN